jgi:hypothetical protein
MKKILCLTAICAAVLVGCTNNDETQELTAIDFTPIAHKSVRSIIEGNVYKTTDPSFGIYSYLVETGTWAANGASSAQWINNAEVSYDGTGKIWKSTPKAYWPLSGKLTFIAYSPKTANATYTLASGTPATGTLKVSSFTVANTTIANQVDLLYSKSLSADDITSADNVSYTYESGTGGNGVGIVFNHALTQIIVNAKVAGEYSGIDYKIKSLTLKSLKDDADLSVVTTFGASATEAAGWANYQTTDATQNIFSGTSSVLTTTGANIGSPVLVLPQAMTANTQKLELVYEMTNKNVTPNVTTTSPTKTVYLFKTSDFENLVMNKKITLNITISADEILYAPTVVDWETDSENLN